MINFLICFDENYNDVAYLFFHTLLKSVSEKVNIFIIHQNPESFSETRTKLLDYEKVNKIEIYKFDVDLSKFPEIIHGHMSEATYYRIYIDKYLPEELENILYVDADIICYQDPIKLIKEEINKLNNSEFIVSARTEVFKEKVIEPHWERLGLRGSRYFNAGVLLINYKKWKEHNISRILENKMIEHRDTLLYWDQDVLNMTIDDKYIELNKSLNFDLYMASNNNNISPLDTFGKEALNKMIFLHYTGSFKPWTVRGAFNKKSIFYHDAYRELFNKKYDIKNTWRTGAVLELLKGISNLQIRNLRYPLSFIYYTLLSLKKKVRK